MEDTYDLKTYKEEYRRVLDLAESKSLEKTAEALDLYYDVCCGCVLVAEASLREQESEWEIASLCRVLLKYAAWLEEFDHMLDSAYSVVSRFEDCLMEHPRLKLRLLELELTIVRRIEALHDHELSHAEDLERESADISATSTSPTTTSSTPLSRPDTALRKTPWNGPHTGKR